MWAWDFLHPGPQGALGRMLTHIHILPWPISPPSSPKSNHFNNKNNKKKAFNPSSDFPGSYFTGWFWDWGSKLRRKLVQLSSWFCSRLLVSHQGSHLTSWYLRSHLCCGKKHNLPKRHKKTWGECQTQQQSGLEKYTQLRTAWHSPLFIIHRWLLHHLLLWRIIHISTRRN